MRVGDKVQDGPPPGTIDAAEYDVTVEYGSIPVLFIHWERHGLNGELARRRCESQPSRQQIGLPLPDVGPQCIKEPVEVSGFHFVQIDDYDILNASACKRLADKAAYAARAYQADPQTSEVRV